ncbi:sulfurtransferase complex subunit TusD [Psychrobacter frigidicola]|uniref:sulfurtransferase complex subunit TusD n=1 Tax=Psychrobacter frigidicola TaxID=45611 RepID=UPI0019180F53|nr:sulfurtransferase complex subunit TusD [Psychrobacter frigidicola]
MTFPPLLLITKDPSHPLAHLALRYTRALLAQTSNDDSDNADKNIESSENIKQPLNIFFYADAAHTANRLRWQSADQVNLTQEWQALAEQYQLPLPVCVSTALSRGISDTDNSARHQLHSDNIATEFQLVGLSELTMMMQGNCRLIQF